VTDPLEPPLTAPSGTLTNPTSDRLFTPAFVKLLWVQMLFGLSYSSFLLLPKFLRLELGASASEIGRVMGAAPIAAACIAPFIGGLALRWSRPTVLKWALFAEAFAAFGFAFSHDVGPHTFLFRVLQGSAWVTVFNLTATMAADLVPDRRMAQAIGYLGTGMLATNAVAPAVAEPLAARYGFPPVYFGAGVLVCFSFFALNRLSQARRLTTKEEKIPAPELTRAPVLTVHYGSFLLGIGIGTMFTYLQPFAIELGAQVVGDFFFGYVGAAVFVRTVLARLTDHMGPARMTIFALTLYSITVGGTAWLEPSYLLLVGIGLGISHGFGYPALTATGFNQVRREVRGRFMSWYTFSFNVGYAFTALFLGPFVDRHGFSALFFGNGILILSGAAMLFLTHRKSVQMARA
jgi:predicted MFS family arabinose efflux permease